MNALAMQIHSLLRAEARPLTLAAILCSIPGASAHDARKALAALHERKIIEQDAGGAYFVDTPPPPAPKPAAEAEAPRKKAPRKKKARAQGKRAHGNGHASPRRDQVLAALARHPEGVSVRQLAEETGASRPAVSKALHVATRLGLAGHNGKARNLSRYFPLAAPSTSTGGGQAKGRARPPWDGGGDTGRGAGMGRDALPSGAGNGPAPKGPADDAPVAQEVEQPPVKRPAAGSNPARSAPTVDVEPGCGTPGRPSQGARKGVARRAKSPASSSAGSNPADVSTAATVDVETSGESEAPSTGGHPTVADRASASGSPEDTASTPSSRADGLRATHDGEAWAVAAPAPAPAPPASTTTTGAPGQARGLADTLAERAAELWLAHVRPDIAKRLSGHDRMALRELFREVAVRAQRGGNLPAGTRPMQWGGA